MRRLLVAALVLLALPSFSGAKKQPPLIVSGRVSTFGPPGEGAGTTATGVSSALPGIALYRHDTLGRHFCVSLRHGRLAAVLRQTDFGPDPATGRRIDVTGAGVQKLGGLRTDEHGKARLLPRKRGVEWRCGA